MNQLRKRLGEVIRHWRETREKTLKEVSEACGISVSGLSPIERGYFCPTEDMLVLVMAFLRIPQIQKNELKNLRNEIQALTKPQEKPVKRVRR